MLYELCFCLLSLDGSQISSTVLWWSDIIYTHDETSPLRFHYKLPKGDTNKQTGWPDCSETSLQHSNIKPAISNNNCRPTTQSSGIWDKNMNMQSPAQDFGERVITLNRAHVNNFGGRRARVGAIEIVRSNGWVFQWLGIWKMYLRRMTIASPRVILVRDGQNCVLRILPWDRCGTRGPLIHRHCNTSLDSLWSWFKRKSFVPLRLLAWERIQTNALDNWCKSWIGTDYSSPLTPEGWFEEGLLPGVHVWTPPTTTCGNSNCAETSYLVSQKLEIWWRVFYAHPELFEIEYDQWVERSPS